MEQRKHPRIEVHVPVSFTGEQISGEGSVLNLSKEGCLIQSDTAVREHSYLDVRVYLPNTLKPVEVDLAAVRWVKGREFGVKLLHMQPEQSDRLSSYIASIQARSAAG
jgi:hypothetical protein